MVVVVRAQFELTNYSSYVDETSLRSHVFLSKFVFIFDLIRTLINSHVFYVNLRGKIGFWKNKNVLNLDPNKNVIFIYLRKNPTTEDLTWYFQTIYTQR